MTDSEKKKFVLIGFYILFSIGLIITCYDVYQTHINLNQIEKNGAQTLATIKVITNEIDNHTYKDYFFEFKDHQGNIVINKWTRAIIGTWTFKTGDKVEIRYLKTDPKNFIINSHLSGDFKVNILLITFFSISLLVMTFRKYLKKLFY